MRDDEYNAGWENVLHMIDYAITTTELHQRDKRTPFNKGQMDALKECQKLMVKRLTKLQAMDRPPFSDVE